MAAPKTLNKGDKLEQPEAVDMPPAHVEELTQEVFIVPAEVFNGIGQYLTQMPFNQVEQLIYGMRMCKPEMRKIEQKDITNDSKSTS